MRLDLATRTLFSEFQEHCFTRVALEHQLKATGTFVRKKIKEKEYWYVQQYTEGKITQQYYGSADKGRTAEIMKTRAERQRQQAMFKKIRLQEARQAAMLRRGGV
ncbi:MAG: hypothetical protein HY540_04205, partial [Deltaproteobacteria bacterium]|nr:hypothetical protein [Deltaproteobacteria bacterium]